MNATSLGRTGSVGRIPMRVKVSYTAFMCVLVPFYFLAYGPTNFLYFCDLALLLTLVALWLENPLLASIAAVEILLPGTLWVADFIAELCGASITGMTAYMFKSSISPFARALSSFHGWLPILLLWMASRLGYDRRAFGIWTLLAWALMLVSYFCLPAPPAPEATPNLPVNVNYVFGLNDQQPQTWMAPGLYFVLVMLGFPLLLFLPAHWILLKLFGQGEGVKSARAEATLVKWPILLWLRYLLWGLTRCVLALRYRQRVHGLDQIQGLKGPVLILPNHPGYIDPGLVLAALWPALKPRPMVFETVFRNPLLWPFAKLLNALRVPDLDSQASAQAREEARMTITAVIDGLKKGENFVVWPSGRIQRSGVEVLGGARALTDILQAVPEATVVLVRTTGIWGSMFSFARTGKQPELTKVMFAGIGVILANLLFFAPRRYVDITVEKLDRRLLPELEREKINPWFENWYNSKGQSQPVFVRYHFLFGPRTFDFPKLGGLDEADLSKIKPETKEAVNQFIADKLHRPLTEPERKPEITLDQLGLDSLDRMDVMLRVEQQFGFSGEQVPTNLGQIWALAQGLVEKATPKPPPAAWFQPLTDNSRPEIKGDTIAAAFVARALASRHDVAAADDLAGAITYERLLVGALLMAKRLAKIPSPNVGLLLPASVACDIALLGSYLAGKLPVILNWTTGPANMMHAVKLLNLTHVVTSKAFVDRTAITVEGAEYLYLEEIHKGMGKIERLQTLLTVRLRPGSVRNHVPNVTPDQPAVVLFTSGSEKAPKAVPLTHSNILSNQRSGLSVLSLTRKDSILGFLPAFHSFGMSVTGLLPIVSGLRVVYHPDPTDAGGLVRKIATYNPTMLVGTPTFLSYIVDRAKPGDLDSLRLILVGAETCPESLFTRCAELAPHAALLEGYGITECSPVVSANVPGATRSGTVGKPLPGVELVVFDLDTEKPAGPNQLGMLLVGGPTIFPGYIGYDGPSPFKEFAGKRWYRTGDLVKIDEDGFVHFCGRMKRFLKAGGEMISLPALEEPFARLYPPTKDGPRVAVEGVETNGGRRIVLFSTEALNVHDANAKLMEEGLRGVMRLDEVRQVEKIPVLGTGKTDYKVLLALIEK